MTPWEVLVLHPFFALYFIYLLGLRVQRTPFVHYFSCFLELGVEFLIPEHRRPSDGAHGDELTASAFKRPVRPRKAYFCQRIRSQRGRPSWQHRGARGALREHMLWLP